MHPYPMPREVPRRTSGTSAAQEVALRVMLGALLIAGLSALWWMLLQQPQRQALAALDIRLEPGDEIDLGRFGLAAPAADRRHLRLGRDADGTWWIENLSGERAIDLHRLGRAEPMRSLTLTQDRPRTIVFAEQAWTLDVGAHQAQVHLESPERKRWTYDGALLQDATGRSQPPCAGAALSDRLLHQWNRVAPASLRRPARLGWGGSVACGNELPVPGLGPGGVRLQQIDGRFRLDADAASSRRVCVPENPVVPGHCPRGRSLFERQVALAEVDRLVVGRTTYDVVGLADSTPQSKLRPEPSAVRLVPLRRAGWQESRPDAPSRGVEPDARVARSFAALSPWRLPTPLGDPQGLVWGAALLFAAWAGLAAWAHVGRLRLGAGRAVGWAGSLTLAVTSALAFAAGGRLGEAWTLLLVTAAVLMLGLVPVRGGWAWASQGLMALMLCCGLALQMQLAAQAADTGGWAYFQKTGALAAAGLAGLALLGWWLRDASALRRPLVPSEAAAEVLLALPALASLVLLASQALVGNEQGVYGIQPVEAAKLALILLGAHVLALRLAWARQTGWRRWAAWWRVGLPVVLFTALVATALLLLRDFSPLVLLAGWAVGAMLAWSLASGSVGASVVVLVALGLVAAGVHWLHGDGLAWLQAQGFYADRFSVWVAPELHPYSGVQSRRALDLAALGGWWGNPAASAWHVPAVQDDMAPAFLLGRFGLAAGLGVLGLQLAYLGCLLMLGWESLLAAAPGDHRRQWALRWLFFCAWGAAAVFATHLLLSWGTNSGFLPVMGQPMPWISAGGSVIALLCLPLQGLWMLQAHLVDARPDVTSPGN